MPPTLAKLAYPDTDDLVATDEPNYDDEDPPKKKAKKEQKAAAAAEPTLSADAKAFLENKPKFLPRNAREVEKMREAERERLEAERLASLPEAERPQPKRE